MANSAKSTISTLKFNSNLKKMKKRKDEGGKMNNGFTKCYWTKLKNKLSDVVTICVAFIALHALGISEFARMPTGYEISTHTCRVLPRFFTRDENSNRQKS
jgi:hypothetical protein